VSAVVGSVRARSWLFTGAAAVLICSAVAKLDWPVAAMATPARDFASDATHSFFKALRSPSAMHTEAGSVPVRIVAETPADVYVVTNTVKPGGDSGWHTHPGAGVVLVKAGVATVYDGDDPSCTATTYPAGTGFVDSGAGHAHLVRNEGPEQLITVAFQIIPAGASRRLDRPNPGHCGAAQRGASGSLTH